MKKLLLLKPPCPQGTYIYNPPLGLISLSSYLKENCTDIDIKIIDLSLNLLSFDNIINEYRPDIVGCSAMSYEHTEMVKIANQVKKIDRNIINIVGGPHPTAFHNEVLICDNIDFAIIGEGEETLLRIIENIEDQKEIQKLKGLAFKNEKDEIIINEQRDPIDVNLLPMPDWDLIDMNQYSKKLSFNIINAGKRFAPIFTSRGCPYHCIYCHNIFGKKFRFRSPDKIIKEIKYLVNVHNVDEIMICDDIFNFNKDRVREICELIISSNLNIKISFPNGVRGDLLDEEIIDLLKKARAYAITIAIETGSERLQKKIKKNINLKKINDVIDIIYKKNLILKVFFMIGFPTETMEEINKTLAIAKNKKITLMGLFIVTPQKNSELYKMIQDHYPDYKPTFDCYDYYMENPGYENVINLPLRKNTTTDVHEVLS